MRLSITYLALSFLATEVLAALSAGPFESVFFYYAYRIDTLAGSASLGIAKGCPGSGPKGVCYFDEFVKWIQQSKYPWTGQTSVGQNLDPDVDATAQELRTSGTEGTSSRCSNKYDFNKVFPEIYPEGTSPSYQEVMRTLVKSIQAQRSALGDDKLTSQLDKARRAFGLTYEARIGDMTNGLINDVNRTLQKNGITWTCETFEQELLNGYTVQMIDTKATIDAHPELKGSDLETAIMDTIEDYDHAKSAGRSHYFIIVALQAYQNLLQGPCTSA
ncbi:hypothetical protein PoHVEF18_007562 [Penicillium ochrochloron]